MHAPLVQLDGVSKKFGYLPALSGVSFSLQPGEVFGYIGPNGAGKTTTLKILAGLIPEFQGELRVNGKPVGRDRSAVHNLIGFLPQSAGFQHWRTVDHTLRTLGSLSGMDPPSLERRIATLLERFNLSQVRHQKVKELSGGMTQKLGLIQAMLHEPKLLILDEPLSGLDPVSRRLVKDIIAEQRDAGTTVLFSSHILSDVQHVADRIGILGQGRLITLGSLDQLKQEFGLPVEVDLELSRPPADLTYLNQQSGVASSRQLSGDSWRIQLTDGAELDQVVHALVTGTLGAGGRLRKVALADPNLDDLYAGYLTASLHQPHATISH